MRAIVGLVLLVVSGCASWRSPMTCPAGQQLLEVNELFFGRDIEGRAPVSDTEWSTFAETVIAREFPDGFTVSEGEGYWRDPATHKAVRERSKIVLVATPKSAAASMGVARISVAYRTAFHQTSVGRLTYEACGAF